MKLDLIAVRYAEAFLEYAKPALGRERIISEAKALKRTILNNPEFMKVVSSNFITIKEKYDFVDDICRDYFSEELIEFIKLLIEKNRTVFLTDILDSLLSYYSQAREKEVLIKSAFVLDEAAIAAIKEKITRKFGEELHFTTQVDSGLLGGVRIEVGSTVIDGSINGEVAELKEEIKSIRIG
jgi:F-type H+-transporting ATPase subunit delta